MTTRTKLALGVGVGLVACSVAWLLLRPGPPPITARVVQYPAYMASYSVVVSGVELQVSNCTSTAVLIRAGSGIVVHYSTRGDGGAFLEAHSSETLAFSFTAAPTQSIQIMGYFSSAHRWRMRALLAHLGIQTAPDFTVTIDLPPPKP